MYKHYEIYEKKKQKEKKYLKAGDKKLNMDTIVSFNSGNWQKICFRMKKTLKITKRKCYWSETADGAK